METIKLIKIMVDARTGYRADMFDKVYGVTANNMAILGNGNVVYILNLS